MKCSEGDLARIIYSIRPENIGRLVRVKEYIGSFNKDDSFIFRGINCQCAITDHYWWIEAHDLSILFGPSPRAYIPDSWLEPISPEENESATETEIEYDIAA